MSTEEIRTINQQILDMNEKMDKNHQEVMSMVKPVYDIYSSAKGFGDTASWIARYVFMPIVVFVGFIVSYQKLK